MNCRLPGVCAVRALALSVTLAIAILAAQPASAETYVEIASRGTRIPALLLKPEREAKAAVILFAGGHGRLDIGADGTIGQLRGNQLVRTRELYRKAGLLTLVPDLAPDMKQGASGVLNRYRASKAYADDMGAMVAWLRALGTTRVVVVGTSRGSLSIANGVSRLAGAGSRRPDAQVMTSGFWKVGPSAPGFTIWKLAGGGNAKSMNLPTLLVWHKDDECAYTLPADVPAFRRWLAGGGASVAVKEFSGGPPAESDVCQARAPHGFLGLDPEVVTAISEWVGQLP
jgi:dienelactone hydrolase